MLICICNLRDLKFINIVSKWFKGINFRIYIILINVSRVLVS